MHAPEIRIGDHFVLTPYRLLEPAYLKAVRLYSEQAQGSYLHILMFGRKNVIAVLKVLKFRSTITDRNHATILRQTVQGGQDSRVG